MIIGFDYFNTITEHPDMFTTLSKVFRELDCKIYVITAASLTQNLEKYYERVLADLDKIGFCYDKLVVLPFNAPIEVPELKLIAAQNNQVDVFFDDRRDVVMRLQAYNIKAIKTPAKLK